MPEVVVAPLRILTFHGPAVTLKLTGVQPRVPLAVEPGAVPLTTAPETQPLGSADGGEELAEPW